MTLTTADMVDLLDDSAAAAGWLATLGITDPRRAHENLLNIARAGITVDLLAAISNTLANELPRLSDPDMSLNNLERFMRRCPQSAGARLPVSA